MNVGTDQAKNFKDLAAPLCEDAESAKKIGEYKQAVEAEPVAHQLGELRCELGVDEVELAERLGTSQVVSSRRMLADLIDLFGCERSCEAAHVRHAFHPDLILLIPGPARDASGRSGRIVKVLRRARASSTR